MEVRSILCATDFSGAADAALREADALARHHSARLLVVHVLPDLLPHPSFVPQRYASSYEDVPRWQGRALEALGERVQAVTGRDAAAFGTLVETGSAHSEITRSAETRGVDLVVVASQGQSGRGRATLGSVAEAVARYAHCPVLVVRPSPASGRVLAATDFSDPSLPAVDAAASEARRRQGRLDVLHTLSFAPLVGLPFEAPVAFPAASDEVRRALRSEAERMLREAAARFGAEVSPLVTEGDPASEIVRVAKQTEAEVVVVGTAGRTGLRRILLGSVAEGVVRSAPCSVLVVRLGGREAPVLTPALVPA